MMRQLRPTTARLASRKARTRARSRARRPEAEALEGRTLLSTTYGPTAWTYSSRITYSFMPDGTSLGGVPSTLFQTLNAIAPTATWQNQIEQAAALWESNANLNLALVPDGGQPQGTNGDQQDDPRFGDIRIGAAPLPQGVLAETFLPPPANGDTGGGDIIFNTNNAPFGINSGFDLETIAAHEFGHALGLGHSSVSTAVMYANYNGIKDSLDSDDIAGIQSIYGAPQYDRFNTGLLKNGNFLTATNITSYIDGNGQIALSGLDNTTPTQSEWYAVTVPASNSGHMTVTIQSSNLSSFAPALHVYNTVLGLMGSEVATVSAPSTYGATISRTISVTAGQKYYISVSSAGGYGRVGAYGLEVNFGNQAQPPIAPPNTVVPQQPDGGYSGPTTDDLFAPTPAAGTASQVPADTGTQRAMIGSLPGFGEVMSAPPSEGGAANPPVQASNAGGVLAASPLPELVLQALDLSLSGWTTSNPHSIGILDPDESPFEST